VHAAFRAPTPPRISREDSRLRGLHHRYSFSDCGFLLVCESQPEGRPPQATTLPSNGEQEDLIRLRRRLYRLSTLRVVNSEDAEDLVQETLLTFSARRPEVALRKGALPWCCGVLRRKVGNYYRKADRFAPLEDASAVPARAEKQGGAHFTPEAKLLYKELRAIVTRLLSRLPRLEREALELLIAGRRVGEIVDQLQPERYQNVVNRIYRGRRKLARELARYGYDSPRRRP
jgi:RNA polymerase sigma factor (sigma-70 family)